MRISDALPLAVVLVLALGACEAPGEADADEPTGAAFVTLLGDDTLAVEQFMYAPSGRIEADVVLRTPRTTRRTYALDATLEDGLRTFEGTVYDSTGRPARRDRATVEGDSLVLEGDGETRRIAADGAVAPFLDMIHWPFEAVLRQVYASGADSATVHLFTGRGTMPFVVRRLAPDSMTIQHPFRGTMGVRVDDTGRLLRLDAGQTTRKLVVTRVPAVDLDALEARFAAADAAGQSFGALSGRGEARATVDGATLTVDYGVPMKRGREIFGALVPFGEVWRTGANRATHFTTDRALTLGGLAVPPGEYTLYTIPEAGGGTLIVNRQTGQGGTTYNQEQDLGRVPMQIQDLTEPVEAFTIGVEDTAEGGALVLQWDRTAFRVPFTVE